MHYRRTRKTAVGGRKRSPRRSFSYAFVYRNHIIHVGDRFIERYKVKRHSSRRRKTSAIFLNTRRFVFNADNTRTQSSRIVVLSIHYTDKSVKNGGFPFDLTCTEITAWSAPSPSRHEITEFSNTFVSYVDPRRDASRITRSY